MTTYLTKIEDGKTCHFRATVENNGVDIVHGVFYNWLGKYFEGCGNNIAAKARQKELIAKKLKEGFQITEFKEILANTVDVYDKAKWHFGGEFPEDLDNFQGYVHTGMFIGWLIDNDLMSDEFNTDHEEEIFLFRQRRLTGSQIFESCFDGVLMLEDLSESGNRFALHYFDFKSGQYLNDYDATLSNSLPSMYHVADTWDNYEDLKTILDKRFTDWSIHFFIDGRWSGYFEYGPEYGDLEGKQVTFSLLLENLGDGQFQGKCVEHEGIGLNPEPATIKGFIEEDRINFIKEYSTNYEFDEGFNLAKSTIRPIPLLTYYGQFNSLENSFEGYWELETTTNAMGDQVYICTGTWKITKIPEGGT